MAKGNVGNLVQHFTALKVADRIVDLWNRPEIPIEVIDCYSMGTWEDMVASQTPQRARFVERCNSFQATRDDFVADVFNKAWATRYGRNVPPTVADRQYPNTPFLL